MDEKREWDDNGGLVGVLVKEGKNLKEKGVSSSEGIDGRPITLIRET